MLPRGVSMLVFAAMAGCTTMPIPHIPNELTRLNTKGRQSYNYRSVQSEVVYRRSSGIFPGRSLFEA